MALLLKPLRCPHCQQPIDKALLRRHGQLQSFLRRKPFPCPHCKQNTVFPEKADTTVSMGIFLAVILAPLFHLWDFNFIDAKHLFALGVAVIVVGVMTQKLDKA